MAAAASGLHKLERPVFAAELDLEALLANGGERSFQAWNRFPAARRDFTFLMARARTFQELADAIERLRPAALESYELTDVYQGPGLPADQVSLSLSFTSRAAERTLTGEEVNEAHREFTGRLAAQLGLIQR